MFERKLSTAINSKTSNRTKDKLADQPSTTLLKHMFHENLEGFYAPLLLNVGQNFNSNSMTKYKTITCKLRNINEHDINTVLTDELCNVR